MSLRLILAIVNLRTVCYKVILTSPEEVSFIIQVNGQIVFGAWLKGILQQQVSQM